MSIGVALLDCASKRVATFMIPCSECDEHGAITPQAIYNQFQFVGKVSALVPAG